MNISMLQDNLKIGLEAVSKSVNTKSSLPVLECVKLHTKDNRLALTTTNLDWATTVYIGASISIDGGLCVPFNKLSKLIPTLSPERVTLDTNTNKIDITCGATRTTLSGYLVDEYPVVPHLPEDMTDYISVSAGKFIEAVKAVEFCAASDDRSSLTCIYIELENNKLLFTTTDAFKMAHKEIDVPVVEGSPNFQLMVSAEILRDVCWVLKKCMEDDGNIFLSVVEDHLFISGGSLEITTHLHDGVFPDYRQFVKYAMPTHATVDLVSLTTALKRAGAVLEGKNPTLSFEVQPHLFYVRVDERETKQETILDSITEGTIKIDVYKNRVDIILAHLPKDKGWNRVKLMFASSRMAFRIQDSATKNDELFYFVMPVA